MFCYFLVWRRLVPLVPASFSLPLLLQTCLAAAPFPWRNICNLGTHGEQVSTRNHWDERLKACKIFTPIISLLLPNTIEMKNCQFAISNLIVFPFWKEYLPLPNSQGDVNTHGKKTVPHIGSHPLIFWASSFQIAALRSILMYTLYGWLQANEWFSNKMFGVNQLSKTAEGMCNQAGFE